jgi:hypothetical protein
MPNAVLLLVGIALMLGAALAMPVSAAPASIRVAIGSYSAVEHAAMACTHRRACHQDAGCAWRRVCKRW